MSRYICHGTDLSYVERCCSLEILPLSYRREIADLVFFYRFYHGLLDVNFSDMVHYNNSDIGTSLRSADRGLLLCSPFARTEKFMASYFNRLPHLWNSLPCSVRESSSISSFRCSLSAFYFTKLNTMYDVDNSCTWTSTCRCSGFYYS